MIPEELGLIHITENRHVFKLPFFDIRFCIALLVFLILIRACLTGYLMFSDIPSRIIPKRRMSIFHGRPLWILLCRVQKEKMARGNHRGPV